MAHVLRSIIKRQEQTINRQRLELAGYRTEVIRSAPIKLNVISGVDIVNNYNRSEKGVAGLRMDAIRRVL